MGAGLLGVVTLCHRAAGLARPVVRFGSASALVAAVGLLTVAALASAAQPELTSGLAQWPLIVIAPFVVRDDPGRRCCRRSTSTSWNTTSKGPRSISRPAGSRFLPHNVYTNMPFDVEMLHLLAMEVMGDWWWGGLAGQLLVALFGPAAAVLIGAAAAREARPARAGSRRSSTSPRRGSIGWRRSPTSKGRSASTTQP